MLGKLIKHVPRLDRALRFRGYRFAQPPAIFRHPSGAPDVSG